MLSPSWYIYNVTPAPKAQGTLQKMGQEWPYELEDHEVYCDMMPFSYNRELQPWNLNNMIA